MAGKTELATTREKVVDIQSPADISKFAGELKQYIVTQGLYTPIQKKNYVNVEGWQFAGACMGVFPVVEKLEDLSYKEGEKMIFKYKAEVKLVRISDGSTVGYGAAICSAKEDHRTTADEFVIASMAQTRAVGKAFRLSIGWIMKLAGYEPMTKEEAEDYLAPVPQMVDIPIEDVKFLVNVKLSAMSASDKTKALKDHLGTIKSSNLTDKQYRLLYNGLREVSNVQEEKADS